MLMSERTTPSKKEAELSPIDNESFDLSQSQISHNNITTDFGISNLSNSDCKKLHYREKDQPNKYQRKFSDIKLKLTLKQKDIEQLSIDELLIKIKFISN
jgi:hypothetical protein